MIFNFLQACVCLIAPFPSAPFGVFLAFFSTFKPVNFTPDAIMQGCPCFMILQAVQPFPVYTFAIHVKNILGRVPMFPIFFEGNTQPTIPHWFRGQRRRFAGWAADTKPDSGNGSCLCEINLWMWLCVWEQERTVSVLRAMETRAKRIREARARAGDSMVRQLSAEGWPRKRRRGRPPAQVMMLWRSRIKICCDQH